LKGLNIQKETGVRTMGKKTEVVFSKNAVSAVIALGTGIALSVLTCILVQRLEFKDLR
jgi:hypothetical protein